MFPDIVNRKLTYTDTHIHREKKKTRTEKQGRVFDGWSQGFRSSESTHRSTTAPHCARGIRSCTTKHEESISLFVLKFYPFVFTKFKLSNGWFFFNVQKNFFCKNTEVEFPLQLWLWGQLMSTRSFDWILISLRRMKPNFRSCP